MSEFTLQLVEWKNLIAHHIDKVATTSIHISVVSVLHICVMTFSKEYLTQLLVYNDWSFIEWFLSKTWMFWAERFLDVCWSSFVFMVSVIKIVHRNLFLAQTESDISSLSSIFQLYEMGRQKSRRKHDRHFQSIREIFYCSQAGSHYQLDLRDISAQSADNYRLRSVVTL